MYPIDNDVNPGRVGFIKFMKWKRVAVAFHDIEYYREVRKSTQKIVIFIYLYAKTEMFESSAILWCQVNCNLVISGQLKNFVRMYN